MICVAVTYLMREGTDSQAIELFRPLAAETRKEPGCRLYEVHRSTTNPLQFFLYEQYVDQAALDAHRAAPHFEKYAKNGLFALIESRSPEIYERLEV